MNIRKLPVALASLHLAIFLCVLIYTFASKDSEASMVWYFFYFIDFPLSLLYFLGEVIYIGKGIPVLEWILYPPYIIHGVLGTVWWFYVGRFSLKLLLKLV